MKRSFQEDRLPELNSPRVDAICGVMIKEAIQEGLIKDGKRWSDGMPGAGKSHFTWRSV